MRRRQKIRAYIVRDSLGISFAAELQQTKRDDAFGHLRHGQVNAWLDYCVQEASGTDSRLLSSIRGRCGRLGLQIVSDIRSDVLVDYTRFLRCGA